MAGVVVRADILEDKDGKSRGIGTVTFEQAIEAVQAICILGQQSWEWGKELGNHSGGEWRLYSKGGYCRVREGQVVVDGKWKEKRNRDKIPS